MRRSAIVVLVVCMLTGSAFAGTPSQNKDLMQQFVAAANAHDYELLQQLVSPGFCRHSQASPSIVVTNRAQLFQVMRQDESQFSDAKTEIEQLVAEGDRVAMWARVSGHFTGRVPESGVPGRQLNIETAAIFRIVDNQIAELWVTWDNQAVQDQITDQKAVSNQ